MRPSPLHTDRHALYEAAAQSVESDLDLFERVYRRRHGRGFRLLREDFCGTAALACAWVRRGPDRRAWGVDHDARVLAWARRHRLARMRRGAERVALLCGDVRRVAAPRVDVVAAMNFSCWVFHERATLRDYFRHAHRSLRPGGMLFVHAFGGHGAGAPLVERSRVPATQGPDGRRLPGFAYVWEQESFNPVDHRLRCAIHFELPGGRRLRRAFTYDWRLWTLPELRELLQEAGFAAIDVHVQGAGRDPHRYRRVTSFRNRHTWLAVVAAQRRGPGVSASRT